MEPEFEDLIREGKTPAEAAAIITKIVCEPEVLEILIELAKTPVGREMLQEGCEAWLSYGLHAPWESLLDLFDPLEGMPFSHNGDIPRC